MRKLKQILASAVAIASVMAVTSCGKKDESSKEAGKSLDDISKEIVNDLSDDLSIKELENKTLKWFSHYNINAEEGKVENPAVYLFKEKYGAKIEWVQTVWDNRYTDLATKVMSNDAPDFFPANDMDAFPIGAINGMFQPIDDYVDLSSPVWDSTKKAIDTFMFDGKHYVAVIEIEPAYACIYNTQTIEKLGFDQPTQLYKDGKWTWDKFAEMCKKFSNPAEQKYALDGFWYWDAFSQTNGIPMISLNKGVLTNNLAEPKLEEAQNYLYELAKSNVGYPRHENDWKTRGSTESGSEGVGQGLTLFLPVGLWDIEDTLEKTKVYGDVEAGEVMFVPMPSKEGNPETYYCSARINGSLLCSGAKNPEGYAAFMECQKLCQDSAQVREIGDNTLRNEYKWTDEMIEMRKKLYELAAANPVFEFYNSITKEITSAMGIVATATTVTNGNQQTWAQIREENSDSIDYFLNEANNSLKK